MGPGLTRRNRVTRLSDHRRDQPLADSGGWLVDLAVRRSCHRRPEELAMPMQELQAAAWAGRDSTAALPGREPR